MLPAKRLWLWHQAKEARKAAEAQLRLLAQEQASLDKQVKKLEEKCGTLLPSADPDEEIARLLAEQKLRLAKKEQKEQQELAASKRMELQQTIQQLGYEMIQLESELDPEFIAAYERLSETKAQPIAEVRNQACMGCFRTLSLSKLDEWRRGKGPVFCDECDRLLV